MGNEVSPKKNKTFEEVKSVVYEAGQQLLSIP